MCRRVWVGERTAQRRRSCKCVHVSWLKYLLDVRRYMGTILDQLNSGLSVRCQNRDLMEGDREREHSLRMPTNRGGLGIELIIPTL